MSFKRFIIIFFLSSNIYAGSYGNINFGFDFINSKALNQITESFNREYLTQFSRVKVVYDINIGLNYFVINNISLGLYSGYLFKNSTSSSETYDFSQSIKYSGIPFGLATKYYFLNKYNIDFFVSLNLGLIYSKLSLSTSKSGLEGLDIYTANAWGFDLFPNLGLEYEVYEYLKFTTSFGYSYHKTAKFKYGSSERYEKGSLVKFNDGSNLTLNLSSVKFLIGVILLWG